MNVTNAKPHPFKPGDWAMDALNPSRVAQVKAVDWHQDEALVDLVLYSKNGDKVGRESPACGGPRSFEPSCPATDWVRIRKPDFPLELKWLDNGDGTRSAGYEEGAKLPPANYIPRKRKAASIAHQDPELRRALEAIADGHNDPRSLASEVLGRKP